MGYTRKADMQFTIFMIMLYSFSETQSYTCVEATNLNIMCKIDDIGKSDFEMYKDFAQLFRYN